MTRFSEDELAAMQAAQEAHMMDRCTLDLQVVGAAGAYNYELPTWPTGAESWCGFQPLAPDEVLDQGADVPVADGKMRLPLGTALSSEDRVTLIERHGVAITPETYEVVGEEQRGPSGLVVSLRKVTDA